jgi:hypothetical protein
MNHNVNEVDNNGITSDKEPMKQLRDLVTVIFTTSAIPSNPSTAVIEEVLKSLKFAPGILTCDVIVTVDGYAPKDKSSSAASKFKLGKISVEEAQRYIRFQERSRTVFRDHLHLVPSTVTTTTETVSISRHKSAEVTISCESFELINSPQLTFITMSKRFGFAFAVREALKRYIRIFTSIYSSVRYNIPSVSVKTPYVLIHQHDWIYLVLLRFSTTKLSYAVA